MQTYYTRTAPEGRPGLRDSMTTIESTNCTEAITQGTFVATSDYNHALKVKAENKEMVWGVAISGNISGNTENLYPYYKANESFGVATRGKIWVLVEEGVEAGDKVYIRFTKVDDNPIGSVSKTPDSNKTLYEKATFCSDASPFILASGSPEYNAETGKISNTGKTILIAQVELH